MHAIILLAAAASCAAMPSFIAVPADQIAFVDLSALHVRRVPRQTLTPPPPPQQQPFEEPYQQQQEQYQQQLQQPYQQQYQQQLQQPYQQQLQPIQELQPIQQLPQGLYREEYAPVQYQQQALALGPEPVAPVRLQQADTSGSASHLAEQRPPDFGEYVDFGAHTGDSGAFGWYADYPINNHEHSSYRK